MAMSDLKALSDQVLMRYHGFVSLNRVLFQVLYESDLLMSCLLEAKEKLTEINPIVESESAIFLLD